MKLNDKQIRELLPEDKFSYITAKWLYKPAGEDNFVILQQETARGLLEACIRARETERLLNRGKD